MAANSHCFAGANTHLAVSDHQKTWESAAQTSTFSMIVKLLTEEQILFQQDSIKASKSHKRNKRKGRQLWSKKVTQVFYYYMGHLIEVYYYSLYGTLWCFLDCFNTSAVLFCTWKPHITGCCFPSIFNSALTELHMMLHCTKRELLY